MALYTINIVDTDDKEHTITCNDDEYLLDAIEKADIDAMFSCRAGACSTCCAKVIKGTVDQTEQCFLDDDQEAAGFVLTCVAYPTSDMTIKLGTEDQLF